MTQLLVSVRSADEARAALKGGATIIDVKEPNRGALGRADDDVINSVIDAVGSQAQTSVALGELAKHFNSIAHKCDFAKIGLAGQPINWRERWRSWSRSVRGPVLVAYADIGHVDELLEFAADVRPSAFLIDTFTKNGKTLLDYFDLQMLKSIRRRCPVPLALAGSLTLDSIRVVAQIQPDIIGVRSAACRDGRFGTVNAALVASLSSCLVREFASD